jgi:hypothetical protein
MEVKDPTVRPFTFVYSHEESLPIQGISATYRARPARVHWTTEASLTLQDLFLKVF